MNKCYSKWLKSLEKNRDIIMREFSGLSDHQVRYHIHVQNCSLAEILDHLMTVQKKEIRRIEKQMEKLEKTKLTAEYIPGHFSGYILRLSPSMNCKPGKIGISSFDELPRLLVEQNRKLETLIRQTAGYNINKRIIPCGLLNMFKVSMADSFEFILKCQQKHLIQARRILMVQNL